MLSYLLENLCEYKNRLRIGFELQPSSELADVPSLDDLRQQAVANQNGDEPREILEWQCHAEIACKRNE